MYKIALTMLTEDKAKYLGLVLSLCFSTIIITQQAAIFIGLMMRTYGTISDTSQAEIWVMNDRVQMIDDIKPLRNVDLFRVRSVEGVAWAVPFYKGLIRARLANGHFQLCNVIGIDDATLIGGPHTMHEGRLQDVRESNSIIVNDVGAATKLALDQGPGKPRIPLRIGDLVELNDRKARVVGICSVTRTFQSQPVIYTTYNRALTYAPLERKLLSFILVASDGSLPPEQLCARITAATGFAAYTKKGFEQLTVNYYLKNTGIPINFGLAILIGMLVGAAIAGQIFYNFTTDNLKYLALFSVMGASKSLLARMTFLQAAWVGVLGWALGSGGAALIGFLARSTELAFHLPWELFIGTGVVIMLICVMASLISIRRIFNIELGALFRQ